MYPGVPSAGIVVLEPLLHTPERAAVALVSAEPFWEPRPAQARDARGPATDAVSGCCTARDLATSREFGSAGCSAAASHVAESGRETSDTLRHDVGAAKS